MKDTRSKIRLDDFIKRLAGEDKVREDLIRGTFIQPAADRAYQEATGKMKPEAEE